jgi:hypothetical protein
MYQKGAVCLNKSTVCGATQYKLNANDIVYIGIFIRIPRRNIEPIGEIEIWINHSQLFEDIQMDEFTYAYVPDGIIERVEIRESATGDLLVFWRIPFRKKAEMADWSVENWLTF